MHTLNLLVAAAAVMAACGSQQPEPKVEATGPGAYRVTVTMKGSPDPDEAQARATVAARSACDREPPRLGRYTFQAEGPAEKPAEIVLTFIQEVRCGGPEEPAPPSAAYPAKDEALIRTLSDRYFAAVAEGRYAAAYELLRPDMHGQSLDEWAAAERQGRQDSGAITSWRLVKLSWAKDPPAAPPGVYAAVDYTAEAEKLAIACGYIIWHGQPDGTWRITRHERYVVSKADAAQASPARLAELRTDFGCAGR